MGGVGEGDLPDNLEVTLDSYDQPQPVECFKADRELAVVVAKAVRSKLGSLGMELVKVCVVVQNQRNEKCGEHDFLCEVVGGPGSEGLRKYLSVELKLRRLWSQAGLDKVRRKQRKECCDELAWWQDEQHKYCGRLIVLVAFVERTGEKFALFGDLRMNDEPRFRSLFGWPASVLTWRPPRPEPVAKAVAKAAPKAAPKSRSSASLRAPAAWVNSQVVSNLQFRFELGHWVAEVQTYLEEIGKNAAHASYYAKQAQNRHHWADSELFQVPRPGQAGVGKKRRRVGGSPAWVAVEHVLQKMHQDIHT